MIRHSKNAMVKYYKSDNLKVTQSENALIVSYTIVTKEFINGKELLNKPQYRLDVWQKISVWVAVDFTCQFKSDTLKNWGYFLSVEV